MEQRKKTVEDQLQRSLFHAAKYIFVKNNPEFKNKQIKMFKVLYDTYTPESLKYNKYICEVDTEDFGTIITFRWRHYTEDFNMMALTIENLEELLSLYIHTEKKYKHVQTLLNKLLAETEDPTDLQKECVENFFYQIKGWQYEPDQEFKRIYKKYAYVFKREDYPLAGETYGERKKKDYNHNKCQHKMYSLYTYESLLALKA